MSFVNSKKPVNAQLPVPLATANLFRRKFLAGLGMAGAALALGQGFTRPNRASAAVPLADFNNMDILNFALNLEYLEAEYYLIAVTGNGLANKHCTGTGTQGAVTGGAQVNFQISAVQQYAEDLAMDERNHVLVLRDVLGADAVARPAIDIGQSFTNAAVAAGIIASGQTFNPYASDQNFLLGAFVFEDVGVTAYHGAAPYLSGFDAISAAAGILAVEAYHAGTIRTALFEMGQATPSLITDANAISALRASADASTDNGHDTPLTDQNGEVYIVAEDPTTSIAYARSFDEVLRIVYLGNPAGTGGGFFPNGLNGPIT